MQTHRLPTGGAIDRARPLRFAFNSREFTGYAGDTLAAALLANGVRTVARSLKYHRPRGIYSAGPEEPNALVCAADGERVVPNQPATLVELYEGMSARSLNSWPSVDFDAWRVNDVLSSLLPAGFYYKTFMWPSSGWMFYEKFIRRAAGLAHVPANADVDRYDKRARHVDVLVIGGGCAGLSAALAVARTGTSVLLCERDPVLGGQVRWRGEPAASQLGQSWVDGARRELESLANASVLTRTTAVGHYDHNLVTLVERLSDHLSSPPPRAARERLWKIRARHVVLAAGAFERVLVFPGNDKPGVMLASAALRYVGQYAVVPGRRPAIYTNNDSSYEVVQALRAVGVDVAAVIDSRADGVASAAARKSGIHVEANALVTRVDGRRQVDGVQIGRLHDTVAHDSRTTVACDSLLIAGGWDPAVHLFSQSGGRLAFDETQQCFVPGEPAQAVSVAGAANGVFDTDRCIEDGTAAGIEATSAVHRHSGHVLRPTRVPLAVMPMSDSTAANGRKAFVDLQSDVVAADLRVAAREGYSAAEHAKRYTTTGMGIDQGKVGNIAALSILGMATGRSVPEVGTTTFRPPFVPVTFGTLAGRELGALFDPLRCTPISAWHRSAGAVFEPVGLWRRPSHYPHPNESVDNTIRRECRAVRERAGIFDASTLGKIELGGRDAVKLLNRIYTNAWNNLAIGMCRYGLMLRENGMVFDDGVCARLAEHHYLMSTTSGGARDVENWLEEWLQCEWRDLDVVASPVNAQWATISLAGPRARDVLALMDSDIDLSGAAFPHLSVRCGHLAGVAARILRVSFTGELSYEINVPARFGRALWELLLARGERYGIEPVGLSAIDALRIEKGFIAVGHETDGTTTPFDLGMAWIVNHKKGDFLGQRGLACADVARPGRKQLVGLLTPQSSNVLHEGSQIIGWGDRERLHRPPVPMIGHVTSSAISVAMGHPLALALLLDGRARVGERVAVVDRGECIEANVVEPRFFDPEGKHLHG